MNAADIASAFGDQHEAWKLFEGCAIQHSKLGHGVIECIEFRTNLPPLFHVRFELAQNIVLFTTKSFDGRKIEISIDQAALKQVHQVQEQREQSERLAAEREKLDKQALKRKIKIQKNRESYHNSLKKLGKISSEKNDDKKDNFDYKHEVDIAEDWSDSYDNRESDDYLDDYYP